MSAPRKETAAARDARIKAEVEAAQRTRLGTVRIAAITRTSPTPECGAQLEVKHGDLWVRVRVYRAEVEDVLAAMKDIKDETGGDGIMWSFAGQAGTQDFMRRLADGLNRGLAGDGTYGLMPFDAMSPPKK